MGARRGGPREGASRGAEVCAVWRARLHAARSASNRDTERLGRLSKAVGLKNQLAVLYPNPIPLLLDPARTASAEAFGINFQGVDSAFSESHLTLDQQHLFKIG